MIQRNGMSRCPCPAFSPNSASMSPISANAAGPSGASMPTISGVPDAEIYSRPSLCVEF